MTDSIDYLRRRAKLLKRDFVRGEASAIERVHAIFPGADALPHTQALHVVARENGAASWPQLKLSIEIAELGREARADRLKHALFVGQPRAVATLLEADPSLPSENFGLLCATYDIDAVRETLADDPGAATRIVGVRSPLLHLAFSKHFQARPELGDAMIAVAEALVAAGADVNDGYPPEPGSDHRLSALYGALGHAGNLALAEWLLERGADPNDNESLYHATELGHTEGLALLMRHGARTTGTNALLRSIDFEDIAATRMLLEHGADPNERVPEHPSGQPVDTIPALHQAARRGRDGRYVPLLLSHGADGEARWKGHSAYALACMYGNAAFAEALAAQGLETRLDAIESAMAVCAKGEVPPGRPLAGRSVSDEARMILTRIILLEDRLRHARCLVEAGLDPNLTDEMGMTPLHLAGWAGLPDQVAWLLGLAPDLGHVNGFGGDLIGSIVHGSENRLDVETRDHARCAQLALEAGARLSRAAVTRALNEDVAAVLADWADAHPEAVVGDARESNR
jgi:ankyrin repeat protein